MSIPIAFGGFGSWGMLWWSALGAIPVIIHLLHKRKFRETTWAAMRFLIAAAKKNSRRIRLEQLLLLMVRVLILLLLSLALAQPYMESLGDLLRADAPTHRILAIDTSLSMQHRPAEFSRFEQAQSVARQVVAGTRQGDALNLARFGELPPRVVVRKPAYRKQRVVEEIDALAATDEFADVAETLKEIVQTLREAPEVEQKEVVILSDFQRANWAPDSAPQRLQLRKLMAEISEKASLVLVAVGGEHAANRAVTSLTAGESFVTTGREVTLHATLRNHGGSLVESQLAELHVDGRLVATAQVRLPPGEDVPVDFGYEFGTAGEHQIEVRLPNDSLTVDDRRWLSLPVKSHLNILLVDGRAGGRQRDAATYYLKKALKPDTNDQLWDGVHLPEVIRDGELPTTDLAKYDCVFLCNIPIFTDREADLLRNYVESGGGVVVCLGDRVRAENYNQVLFRDGKSLLPVKLGDARGDARNLDVDSSLFRFDTENLDHPIVNAYAGNIGRGLETSLFFQYIQVELPEATRATPVLTFTNSPGDPAIVDAPVGRGRVIVFTTSVDDRWGGWPVQPQTSFPPIVHETIRHAVSGRWSDRQRLVGQPISQQLGTSGISVEVLRPNGDEPIVQVPDGDDRAHFTYSGTDRAGIYRVELGPPAARADLYAVNADPRESRLESIPETELKDDLFPGVEFTYRTQWEESRTASPAAGGNRNAITRWLLSAVFCLLLVELLMAWRFHYGFVALCGLVALAFIVQSFAAGAIAGIVFTALMFAILVVLVQRFAFGPRAAV